MIIIWYLGPSEVLINILANQNLSDAIKLKFFWQDPIGQGWSFLLFKAEVVFENNKKV